MTNLRKSSTIVIATHNPAKGREMAQILGKALPEVNWKTLNDYPGAPEPKETGSDYEANALIKAKAAAAFTGQWAIADDAGLEVDALNGAPGLYSKRFAGVDTQFAEKMARILAELEGLPIERRTARFRCWVALAPPPEPEANPETFEGICEGWIAEAPSGSGGFGYDPIFFVPERGCCMADLTPEEKHAVSHRGKVLAKVAAFLNANFVNSVQEI